MKLRKNINRIAMLTSLLIINTNVKGFYQCVPKKDWFKNQYDILMLEDKFKVAKTQIDNKHAWELVAENKTSGSLSIGVYKVVLAGGQGGMGYGNNNNSRCYGGYCSYGGDGGMGELKTEIFLLTKKTDFSANIGIKGSTIKHGNGTNGTSSSFTINSNKWIANFGYGGQDAHWGECYNVSCTDYGLDCQTDITICSGKNGKGYNPGNSGNGYVRIYRYIG